MHTKEHDIELPWTHYWLTNPTLVTGHLPLCGCIYLVAHKTGFEIKVWYENGRFLLPTFAACTRLQLSDIYNNHAKDMFRASCAPLRAIGHFLAVYLLNGLILIYPMHYTDTQYFCTFHIYCFNHLNIN